MGKLLPKKLLFFSLFSVALVYFVLLRPFAGFLIIADTPKHSGAIVVLGGGLAVPRVAHAVKLHEKGLAPIIILTGQEMEFSGREIRFKNIKLTESLFASLLAKLYGIPERNLFLGERPYSTYGDAKYVKEDLLKMCLHSAIIVSAPYRMRRVSIIFKKVFKDTSISLTFSPAVDDDNKLEFDTWWSPDEIHRILSEYAKIAYYLIRY
ncbi:MAG TPA: YdcF family protein [Candidatus Brocadiaceae bacterium]